MFNRAVEKIAGVSTNLLATLVTAASPRNRDVELAQEKSAGESQIQQGRKATHALIGRIVLARVKESLAHLGLKIGGAVLHYG